MEFLYCIPSVFVIGDEYEILINLKENGLCFVEIGGERFFEENTGVLPSERRVLKVRVPQKCLDGAKKYEVCFKKTVERKSYFPKFGEEQRATFAFRPLEKSDGINIYHLADVHYQYEIAKKTASYFGDALDLLILNGDIGEAKTEQSFLDVCQFVGEISRGEVPVIFARGNHDARGHLAERYTDYFPCQGKNTYYTFEIGPLCGVVLDCGEDKPDVHAEYGGTTAFEAFRRRESAFLERLSPRPDKLTFAVSHIAPPQVTRDAGSEFDIERELYTKWCRELSRIGVRFMLSGHIHETYILEKNDKASLVPHDFPVVVGSHFEKGVDVWGTALTLSGDMLAVRFTDCKHEVRAEFALDPKDGNLKK